MVKGVLDGLSCWMLNNVKGDIKFEIRLLGLEFTYFFQLMLQSRVKLLDYVQFFVVLEILNELVFKSGFLFHRLQLQHIASGLSPEHEWLIFGLK